MRKLVLCSSSYHGRCHVRTRSLYVNNKTFSSSPPSLKFMLPLKFWQCQLILPTPFTHPGGPLMSSTKMNLRENPEYRHTYCLESERLGIMSVIISEHVLERTEPLSPFHTPLLSVWIKNILAVIFHRDLAPLWIFRWVATQSNYLSWLGWCNLKYSPLFRDLENV